MFTIIKRTALVGLLALSLGYAGDACSVQNILHSPFIRPLVVQDGYARPENLELITKENENGTHKTFLGYYGIELPLFSRQHGPQIGTVDYIWNNLNHQEQQQLGERVWNSLDNRLEYVQQELNNTPHVEQILTQEQNAQVFSTYWQQLPVDERATIIGDALPTLDEPYRKALALRELAVLLGAPYDNKPTEEPENVASE